MAKDRDKLPSKTSASEVDAFLDKVARMPVVKAPGKRGRLIFAMDATASREPTWDRACHIQAEMFTETDALGGLDVQLAFYRGFGDFRATAWAGSSKELLDVMTGVRCLGGQTQIAKVLRHAVRETKQKKVDALVFVGDCCEEDVDQLCHIAGQLGLLGVPAFMFHEGAEPVARSAFQQIARLTGGACCSFDAASAQQLRDLLAAVAVFAAGGRPALEDYSARKGGAVRQITQQVR
ncbi:MAG: VWA domain-containing protein [Alphaproteobacteria bacterium]|nr:VWA domain-containing protein [Alphaproteobacteria bacterium]